MLRRVRVGVAAGAHDRPTGRRAWCAVRTARHHRAADGTTQVTYAGHPLYFYAHEEPRQVLCHDFEEFGGIWHVVQPDGEAAP